MNIFFAAPDSAFVTQGPPIFADDSPFNESWINPSSKSKDLAQASTTSAKDLAQASTTSTHLFTEVWTPEELNQLWFANEGCSAKEDAKPSVPRTVAPPVPRTVPPPPRMVPAPSWMVPPPPWRQPKPKPKPKHATCPPPKRQKYEFAPKGDAEEQVQYFQSVPKVHATNRVHKTKPQDGEFKRKTNSRTSEDRVNFRARDPGLLGGDRQEIPWDLRGPYGPDEGGPNKSKKQKFREGSQRWGNSGGEFKHLYDFYFRMKRSGLTGPDLEYYHPMSTDGHWAREQWSKGQLAPFQRKEQKRAEEEAQKRAKEAEQMTAEETSASAEPAA